MFPFPLQITFGNDIGRFDLEVTTFQMAVLFAWNQRPKDRISYESLKLATELPDTELRRTLWVCFNFSLLCITSNSQLIYLSAYMRHSPVLTICSNIYNLSSNLFPTVDVSSGSFSPVFFQSSMGFLSMGHLLSFIAHLIGGCFTYIHDITIPVTWQL